MVGKAAYNMRNVVAHNDDAHVVYTCKLQTAYNGFAFEETYQILVIAMTLKR